MTKRKTIIATIIILSVVAFIFLAATGFEFKLPFAAGGFSALSLGQVDFSSNDPLIGGQAWLITVSQNGAGQYVQGTFKLTDGQSSSDQFTLKLSLDENYATYIINNQGIPIRKVEWTTTKYPVFGVFVPLAGCNPDVWTSAQIMKPLVPGVTTVYCYKYTTDGYYGTISSGSVNFKSTISVDGSKGSDSCSISNSASTSCFASDGKVQASWAGSLVSGQVVPQPTDQNIIAVYDTKTGGWKTASLNSYTNWKNYDSTGLSSCLNGQAATGTAGTSCFQTYTNYENSLMSGMQFTSSGGNVAITSGSQSNGKITLNLPVQVQFPVITMRIKASLIGINIPVGDPEIVSLSSQQFQTGQSGIIEVTVKNVGTGDGSFDVSASCSAGFSQTGNALRISSLAPGAIQTVYIPISANVVTDGSGTCSVLAKDVNNPNNYDTKSVSVSASALSVCTSGEKRISGNSIEECKNNVWTVIKNCGTLVPKYVGTDIQCVEADQGGDDSTECAWYDLVCHGKNIWQSISDFFKGVGDFFGIVKIVVSVIVGIFGTLTAKDIIGIFKALRKKEWIAWILAAVIGIALFLFIMKIFWVGLIVFVIFFIAKKIIKLTPIGRFI